MCYLNTVQSLTEIVGKVKQIETKIEVHALSGIDDVYFCKFVTIPYKITRHACYQEHINPNYDIRLSFTVYREFTKLPELTQLLLSLQFLINEIIAMYLIIW